MIVALMLLGCMDAPYEPEEPNITGEVGRIQKARRFRRPTTKITHDAAIPVPDAAVPDAPIPDAGVPDAAPPDAAPVCSPGVAPTTTRPQSVRFDMNGDGILDEALVAVLTGASSRSRVEVYRWTAAGREASAHLIIGDPFEAGSWAASTTWGLWPGADIDHDGTSELLLFRTLDYGNGKLSVYFGSAAGLESAPRKTFAPTFGALEMFGLSANGADMDGDGNADIAFLDADDTQLPYGYIDVRYGTAAPQSFRATGTALFAPCPGGYCSDFYTQPAVLDYDCDGYADVASRTWFGRKWYVHRGGPSGIERNPSISL